MPRPELSAQAVLSEANKSIAEDKLAEAYQLLRNGLVSFPRNTDILHLAGQTAFQLGLLQEAATILNTAVVTNPTSFLAQLHLAIVLRQRGELFGALKAYYGA